MKLRVRLSRRRISAIGLAVFAVGSGKSLAQTTVTFEQNADGQGYSYTAPDGHVITGNFPSDNDWSQSVTDGTYGYTVDNTTEYYYYEDAPSNWSIPTYPDSTADNVVIPGLVTTDDVTTTIGDLTITSGGVIDLLNNQTLTIDGPAISDNGAIVVNSGQNGGATILDIGGGTVSGTGSFVLNYPTTNAQLNGSLTQDAGHSIVGWGEINAALINNGVVNADENGEILYLQTNNMTNNSLFEATGGGTMYVNGISITQGTAGLISVGASSQVDLVNATVTGGTLTSTAGVVVQSTSGTNTLASVTNDAQINMIYDTQLNVTGNLVDNGSIVVNSGQNGAPTILNISGGTVSGTGSFVLNYPTTNAQLNGSLTQSAGHSIVGFGEINAALINNGVVNADVSGQILYLQTSNMTNNSLFEATSGGTIDIGPITITQSTAGLISVGTSSLINLTGGTTISGGTLATAAGTVIQDTAGTNTLASVISHAQINMLYDTQVNVTGNLVDDGSIVVNSGQNGAPTILDIGGGTVSGTGTFFLNYATSNAQLIGSLTQSAGHSIVGWGEIYATLVNNGLVNADENAEPLYVYSPSVTNNNLMEATAGGILQFDNVVSVNNAAGQIIGNGGNIVLTDGATISGGTIAAVSPNTIQVQGAETTLGVTATLTGGITIASGTTVNVVADENLIVTGSTLTNNGTIVVNSGQNGDVTTLTFDANTLLNGAGDIYLNYVTSNAQLNTGAGDTLTQAAGNTIQGWGEVNASLVNDGLVNADISNQSLYLLTNNMTNNATFEATVGGTLNIDGISVTQGTAGMITAGANSTVVLTNATISNGTLNSGPTATFQISGTSTIASLTSNALIEVPAGNVLNVTGNLVDNDEILVNVGDNGDTTILDVAGGTVSGTGTFVLNSNTSNAQLNGTLTQASTHTISGFGEVNAALTNNGLVDANVKNEVLYLQTSNMTNSATFEATNGSTLEMNGITVTQSPLATITAGTNSVVVLNGGATVSGGTLNGVGNSYFQVSGTDTINSLTSNALIEVPAGNDLNVTGNLIDNDEILVNVGNNSSATILNFAGGMVSGTGTFVLNSNTSNAQLNGTLTQASTHTISGFGEINAALTNDGVVNANVVSQTLYLLSSPMTNNATFESTNGGTLEVDGITVTQIGSGTTTAGTNSVVVLNGGATISGGTLNSVGNAYFEASGTDTIGSLTNNALIEIPYEEQLNVTGNLTDNGEVVVNSAQNGAPAILNVEGGTVSGSGDFVLNYSTTNAQLIGTLTQASTHTISGFGEINAVLTNNGVVNANVLNQTLYLLGGPMANNATFESTNGGTLAVYGVTVTQSASGTTTAGTNSVVSLNSGALITGGTLVSVGNASFQVSGTDTIGSLTSDALIEIPYEEQLNVAGNLTDNGEVVVNSGQNGAPAILDVEGGTVSGSGDFALNYSTTNAQLNGTLTQASTHTISGFGQINANLDNFGTVNADVNNQQLQVNGTTTNNGLFEASGGGILQVASGVLTNLSGTTLTGGTYEVNASSTINLPGPVTVNAANIILNGASTSFSAITGTTAASQTNLSTNSGSFTLENGASFSYLQGTASAPFVNTGTVSIGSGSTFSDNGKYSQSAGLSLVDGTLSTGSGVSLTGGTLSGTGTLSGGTVALSGGEIEPGAAPADGNIGTLSMAGLNISGGNLRMDIGAGSNDNIVVSGTTSYSGASTVTPVFDNYLPVAGTYNLITAASVVVNAGDAPSLVNTLPPDTRFTLVLQETSTAVNLVVGGSAASTVWVGTPGSSAWDLVTTKNWWNPSVNVTEQADDYFYNLDTVTFNDTATKFNVALNTNVVPLAVTVNDSAHNYTISGTGGIGGTATLGKTGTGTLTLSTTNSYTGATSVTGGELIASSPAAIPSSSALSIGSGAKVQLAANIGPATLASLAISTGAALDVTNNTVIVNYGATDPIASIVSALASGYDSGTWTGVGINSSAVASLQASQSKLIYSVGYADGADGLIAGLNPGQIEIMPTLAGDAKLQGDVVFGDFQILAQYFGKPNTSWDEGDFTYNGATNFGDFQMLAQDFGQTASGLASSEFTALNSFAAQFGDTLVANASGGGYSVVALPEPASIGLVAVSLGLLARRRRRR